MNKKNKKTLRLLSFCMAMSAIFSGWIPLPCAHGAESVQRPNIIFILADDLGWGDLGCYKNPWIKTPNIDRLAKNGILFTNAYAGAPVCSPTRAGILTGCNPSEIGFFTALGSVDDNKALGMPQWLPLPDKLPNIADFLHQNGYATAHFGKWHLGGPWQKEAPAPAQYGYDAARTFVSTGPQLEDPRPPSGHEEAAFSERIVNLSIDFIQKNSGKPFFINAWMSVPHAPLIPSKKMMEAYPNFVSFGPQFHERFKEDFGADGFSTPRQVYYSMITDMDAHIGRLLDELERLGIANNTLVVFSSDNGPEIDEWPFSHHAAAGSAGPFRGQKRSIYEGGIRLPFIASWPAQQSKKGVVDKTTVISLTDLPATFSAAAGLEWKGSEGNDSVNMLAALQGTPVKRAEPLFWETRFHGAGHPGSFSPMGAIREGEWKLLANPDRSRVELYNLTKDPGEHDNVATNHPDIAKRLFDRLTSWQMTLPARELIPKSAGTAENFWSQLAP